MFHKSRFLKALLFIVLCLLSISQAGIVSAGTNVWTSSGPEGGNIIALAINPATPSTLYAGTYGAGLFISTDGSSSWSPVSCMTFGAVETLAINPVTPTTIYAGVSADVFKSTDSGTTWKVIDSGLPSANIRSLAINPVTPSTVYAGTSGGVFKSTNSGKGWSAFNTGLTNTNVMTVAIDPVTPSTLYAGTWNAGVFKSIDSGNNWSPFNSGLTNLYTNALAINPSTPSTLYVGGSGGVFQYTASGGSWSAVNTGLSSSGVWSLAIDPGTPSTLYAGTGSGVYKSINDGGNWNAVINGLTNMDDRALVINPRKPSTLYVGTNGGGVLKSTTSGASWSTVNTGIIGTYSFALAVDPSTPANVYAGTQYTGAFKSTNGGGSWSALNNGLAETNIDSFAIDPSTPATVYTGAGGTIFKSFDSGGSWTRSGTGFTGGSVGGIVIDPTTTSTLYAGTSSGVFQSINSGGNWSAVNTGLTTTAVQAIAIDPSIPTTLYVGTGGGGVFKTTTSGGSWSAVNTNLTNNYISDLAIDPNTPSTLYAASGTGVFKSSNGGGNWSAINTGLTNFDVCALVIDPLTPTVLYAGTSGGGVFQSTDGGATWNPINTGLMNTYVYALAINPVTPSILYAGTYGSGVFSIQLPLGTFNKTVPVNGANKQPTSLTLSWGVSPGASSYKYCLSTTNTCSTWTGVGGSTSVDISGLSRATTYYWHVLAKNGLGSTVYSDGSSAAFSSFTTAAVPGKLINSYIGGVKMGTYEISSGSGAHPKYAGVNDGPVQVGSSDGTSIIATQRLGWKVNGAYTSMAEMMGLPANQLTNSYIFTWYNDASMDTQLRIGNVGTSDTNVTVTIGTTTYGPYLLHANDNTSVSYTGVNGGPVTVQGSDPTVPIIVTERLGWKVNGAYTSMAEIIGLPANQLTNNYVFAWYNDASMDTQLRIGNVGTSDTNVTVTIGTTTYGPYLLHANGSTKVSYAGVSSGPVTVQGSDPTVPIIADERLGWKVDGAYTSMAEMTGLPANQLANSYVFAWYDDASMDTQLRIGNVGTSDTNVTVTIGTTTYGPYLLHANGSTKVSYAGVSSGPVTVQGSDPTVPIITTERVGWKVNGAYTSMAEMIGLAANKLTDSYIFAWYDGASMDTQLRIGVP